MKRELTIGYVTVDDPLDRRTWSGINNFLFEALRRQVTEVIPIGPLRPRPVLFFCQVVNQVRWRLFGKRWNYRDSFIMARAYRRTLRRRVAGMDLIVAPAGLCTMALLDTQVPIVYVNDRCTAGALDYHRILTDLTERSRKESLAVEQCTLENADLVIYSSQWAADAAVASNASVKNKVKVVPFGANLTEAPAPPTERVFPPAELKLLMLAVKWEDKGGPIAYEALQEVKRRGQAAKLVVCGVDPPEELDDPDLVREGFLNKNDPADMARLMEHLRTADLLILPTRFEAYGLVFCEAAAYGLPVLASRTGGIPTIVQDGRTGFLFDLEESGGAYADRIMELVRDPERWQAMRRSARERYAGTLTWEAFVHTLMGYVDEAGLISRER